MQRDRTLLAQAFGEVVALDHAGDRILGGKADDVVEREFTEPLRVEANLGLLLIEDVEDLPCVGGGVLYNLVFGQGRPRAVFAGGITDACREVADEKYDLVSEVLKLSQFGEHHDVTKVQIRSSGIGTQLDHQRPLLDPRALELFSQFFFHFNVDSTTQDDGELFFDGRKHGHRASVEVG